MYKTRPLNVVGNKMSKQKLLKKKSILTNNKHNIDVFIVFKVKLNKSDSNVSYVYLLFE
jgi:hypothetical protein